MLDSKVFFFSFCLLGGWCALVGALLGRLRLGVGVGAERDGGLREWGGMGASGNGSGSREGR